MNHAPLGLVSRALRKANRLGRRARERVQSVPIRLANRRTGTAPIPPSRLIFLIANRDDAAWYLSSGELAAQSLRNILDRNGLSLERMGGVLDFGCGVGRVLRHWQAVDGPEFHGADLSNDAVSWCRRNLPFGQFQVNSIDRPLEAAPQSFDLIYAFSVFTHMSEPLQRFWMHEMSRLLRPGGHLVFSVHGTIYLPQLQGEERRAFLDGRFVARHTARDGSNDCAAFHPEKYVRSTMSAGWDVLDFLPEGALGNPRQDLYLLRKTA